MVPQTVQQDGGQLFVAEDLYPLPKAGLAVISEECSSWRSESGFPACLVGVALHRVEAYVGSASSVCFEHAALESTDRPEAWVFGVNVQRP